MQPRRLVPDAGPPTAEGTDLHRAGRMVFALLCAFVFASAAAQEPMRLAAPSAHQGVVESLAISPGGDLVATGGGDQRIHLWHLPSARQWRTLSGHAAGVVALAFSPDGTMLASGDGEGGVRIWRVADGASLCSVRNPNDRDGLLAGAQEIRRVAWSGNGEFWSAGNYGMARRWRVAGCAEAARIALHDGALRDAAVVGDGWWIAGARELIVADVAGKVRARVPLPADTNRFIDPASRGDQPALMLDDGSVQHLEADGRPARRVEDPSRPRSIALLPGGWIAADDNRVLTLNTGGASRDLRPIDDATSGNAIGRISSLSLVAAVGELVVAAGASGIVVLDAKSGAVRVRIDAGQGYYSGVLAASPDGRWLVQAGISDAVLWDLRSGRATGTLKLPTVGGWVRAAQFDAASRNLLLLDYDMAKRLTTLRRFDLAEGRFAAARAIAGDAFSLAVDPSSGRAFVGQSDGVAVFGAGDLAPAGKLPTRGQALRLSIDAKGGSLLSSHGNGVDLLKLPEGTPIRSIDARAAGGPVSAAELSADGGTIWIAAGDAVSAYAADGALVVWKTSLPISYGIVLRRSPDGRRLLASGSEAAILDASSGAITPLRQPAGASDAAWLDARSAVALGADGSLRLWRDGPAPLLELRAMERPVGTGCVDAGLCQVVPPWLVSSADGRFDTGDFAALDEFAWYRAAEPFRALPFGLYARNGFEPRLLARTLAAGLPPRRDAPPRKYDPPGVRIVSVGPSKEDPASLRVEIEVEPRGAGLASVHLLRDGVRVARVEAASLKGARTLAVDPVRYTGFTLAAPLRFTAIAYDTEGAQGTAVLDHKPPFDARRTMGTSPPTQFVVSVGVNRHENRSFDLAYAANDARRVGDSLAATLAREGGATSRVVRAMLVSDDAGNLATKARIREALQILAGAAPASADPALKDLRRAGPDDTVIVSFAGHGFNGADGEFHLVAADTGPGSGQAVTPELQRRAISSRELAEWLDGLDAGRAVLILDACHAAAAVNVRDFVPGPMDSRGLGQLAYDKGLAVLVATQADDVALESGRLQQGILSYALVAEGLEKGAGDFAPRDGRMGLVEWLGYAVGRVPVLAQQVKSGTLPLAPGSRAIERVSAPAAPPLAQTPALFYFARGRPDATLARTPAR